MHTHVAVLGKHTASGKWEPLALVTEHFSMFSHSSQLRWENVMEREAAGFELFTDLAPAALGSWGAPWLLGVSLTSRLPYPTSALFLSWPLRGARRIFFPSTHSFWGLISFYLIPVDAIQAPFGRFSSKVFRIANGLVSAFGLAGLSGMHT